jgi:hypothetical protein
MFISTAAIITSELGLVARQQVTEEMNNITDGTMLRDATAKKNHLFCTRQIKTSDKTLTLSISNCKASISSLRSLIKDLIVLHCTLLSSILACCKTAVNRGNE